jgi:AcrR family transcriptional regulator
MKPADRRTQLLDAARSCFVQGGFDGTPVSAIVKAAGVAQGTFYLYFDSKQGVVTELRREVVRDYDRVIEQVAALEAPVDERFARIVAAISVAVGRNIALERMFRAAGSGEASLKAAHDGRRRLSRRAAELLLSDPAFDPGDAPMVARFIVTLFDQILFEAHAFEPASVPAVVDSSLRFILRGLGVSEPRIETLVAQRPAFTADAEAL